MSCSTSLDIAKFHFFSYIYFNGKIFGSLTKHLDAFMTVFIFFMPVEGGRAQAASALDMPLRPLQGQMDASEEDPIYDSVASEEDYSLVEIQSKLADAQQILALQSNRVCILSVFIFSLPCWFLENFPSSIGILGAACWSSQDFHPNWR